MNTEWIYSERHNQICQIIEVQTLWGETNYRVWLPGKNTVELLSSKDVKIIDNAELCSKYELSYISTAAKIADILTQDILISPIESTVIPLPHQLKVLSRAMASERVRYLLADEVGLGKTIEAGLVLRELKLRGLVKRILVVAPKGLVTQWISEMKFHFGETFRLILPEDIKTLSRFNQNFKSREKHLSNSSGDSPTNTWQMFSQVVVPMDSFKPLDKRRGWTLSQINEYNRDRFEDLVTAGWDLVIVDEAHRLGGSNEQVARFKLGQGLAAASPYLLLLSATPHQGKTDAFHRVVSLIDSQEFADISNVNRENVQPYVIRTERNHAIDAEGKPLFKPRNTQLASVNWETRHQKQKSLYEAVSEYVREGYNQAVQEKKNYIGFLMILMQRLVVSSTRAIRVTLQRRLEALAAPQEQLTIFPLNDDEWADLDSHEQVEVLLKTRLKALKNERAEVRLLLDAAMNCEQSNPDAKAEELLNWLYQLQSEENDPELKVLIFTEFVPTQEMLHEFLLERGFTVTRLNGSLDMEERKKVQDEFASDTRILISTDAGGEGLNLQFCHIVINYDIPWNPMRLEQRIGRVDRIGQLKPVRTINFVFEDSIEHRVREVLEHKLGVIFREFGIDKTGDVLDSAESGRLFNEMYVEAILNPENINDPIDQLINKLKSQANDLRSTSKILGESTEITLNEAQQLFNHPLQHWIEQMTLNFLLSHDGQTKKADKGWNLTWPSGETYTNVVFTNKEAQQHPGSRQLTLEDPNVGILVEQIPRFIPKQSIPQIRLKEMSNEIRGIWSLWQISISSINGTLSRIMPLFVSTSKKVLFPTAKYIWDQLLTDKPIIESYKPFESLFINYEELLFIAEEHGKKVYEGLLQEHEKRITRETRRAQNAINSRRKSIERIGLSQVRNHRLMLLTDEERKLNDELLKKSEVTPELVPIQISHVESLL